MASKKRTAKKTATRTTKASASPATDHLGDYGAVRDGPTAEYRQHHRIVSRAAGVGGQRHYSRLEQLWDSDYIKPEDFAAGWRFGRDYEIGIAGAAGGSLSFRVSGGGDGHPSMNRLDGTRRFVQASECLDAQRSLVRPGSIRASEYLVMFVVHDESVEKLRVAMSYKDWAQARGHIILMLEALTKHYADVDKTAGKSSTPHTREGVQRLIEPDDRRLPTRG
jgi:hypothetical protein